MYRRPSVSTRYAPSPRATKNGSPPTAPNVRTGELTPPGMRACARSNSDSAKSGVKALGDLARQVREHEVGAGALDGNEVLERDIVAVEPAELRGRLHHCELPAHVERGHGNVERVPDGPDHVEVRERRLHHHHV